MRRDVTKVLFWIIIFAIASTLFSIAVWTFSPQLPWWFGYAVSAGVVILSGAVAAVTLFVIWLYGRWFD